MNLTELEGKGLEGGTLVEYVRGCQFMKEWGRAKVTCIGFSKDQEKFFEIKTDGEVRMGLALDYYSDHFVKKSGEIYLWDSPLGWCYAVAPAGVEIAPPPAMDLAYDLVID